jgi:ribosomal protein S18 acetylase RimI-like enzyme
MTLDIRFRLEPQHIDPAIDLMFHGLGEKLVPIFGPLQQSRALIRKSIDPNQCLVALCDDRVVGLLAIKSKKCSFIDPNLQSLFEHYGFMGTLGLVATALLIDHTPSSAEWYVDSLVVCPSMRGKGIGQLLLQTFQASAEAAGIHTLSLDVVDTNPRARELYERLGYRIVKRAALGPLTIWLQLPFNESLHMVKQLPAQPLPLPVSSKSQTA